jgi:hypothetical protein
MLWRYLNLKQQLCLIAFLRHISSCILNSCNALFFFFEKSCNALTPPSDVEINDYNNEFEHYWLLLINF